MFKNISYTSIQSHAISRDQIEALLRQSRANNVKKGITGLLIYSHGLFTQYLEGPENEIDLLYERLKKDTRHTRVTTLTTGKEPKRYFKDWSMAYKSLDSKTTKKLTGFKEMELKRLFAHPNTIVAEHPGLSLLKNFITTLQSD